LNQLVLLSLCNHCINSDLFRVARSVPCRRDEMGRGPLKRSRSVYSFTDFLGWVPQSVYVYHTVLPPPGNLPLQLAIQIHLNLWTPVVYFVVLLTLSGIRLSLVDPTGSYFDRRDHITNHSLLWYLRRTVQKESADGSIRCKATTNCITLFRSVVLYGNTLHNLLSN